MLIENKTELKDLVEDLKDRKLTVLVLLGAEGGTASSLHDYYESKSWDPWNRCYLIFDLGLLTPDLKTRLKSKQGEIYRVLGGEPPKTLGDEGEVSRLRRESDAKKWARLRIRKAFAKGDQLGVVPGDHA